MINPYRGVLLGGRYYNYDAESFRFSLGLRNTVESTQDDRTVSAGLGKDKKTFSISLDLENTYEISAGSSEVGSTFWSGVSRLADLEDFAGAAGESLPVTFVAPYGMTYDVVPVGEIGYGVYRAQNPGSSGMEFTAAVTLEEI